MTMTIFSFSSRFYSALSICALLLAATPTLAEVATELDPFSTIITVEGRDTPFNVRQREMIGNEFETLYNAVNDDYSVSFVKVTAVDDKESNVENRELRRWRSLYMISGGQRCSACTQNPINADRRVLRGEKSDSRPMMLSYDDDEFITKLGTQLEEIFDGISLVVPV